MAFKTLSEPSQEINSKNNIDFDALNQHIVDRVGCQTKKKLTGVVVGIIDLGEQPQEDGKYPIEENDKKNPEDFGLSIDELNTKYEKELADESNPLKAFEVVDGKICRVVKRKPIQAVDLAIEFPRKLVNRGQFFGSDEGDKPFRTFLGGDFFFKQTKEKRVAFPLKFNYTKLGDNWSLSDRGTLYKMAVDSGVIEQGQPFLPQDITKLLGQSFSFDLRVFLNEVGDRKYLSERVKYAGTMPEELEPYEEGTYSEPFVFNLQDPVDKELMKNLRKVHIASIMFGNSYVGSTLEAYDLENMKEKVNPTKPSGEKQEGQYQDLDDDMPF